MTETESRFSRDYHGTMIIALLQQAILGMLCAIVTDGGTLMVMCLYSLVAFWIVFFTILLRRPKDPTKGDIVVIKWGTLIFFLISIVISPLIWRLRGAI